MGAEPSHVQLVEYKKEVIPYINWMMEDIFCRYGVSIPYFLLEFDFPEYPFTPQYIPSGYGFGVDWGDWGSFLPWFNELIGLAFDLADLPRWQFTPWEIPDWKMPEWGIPDWELPQWQLRNWPEWSIKDGELRRRWGRRLGPELDVLDYVYIPPGRGFGAGVSGGLGAGWRIGADWTVGGTLSARLGIEIPVSIELSSPDWTVKMELEGKLREDPMRLTESQYPLGIEGFFPERTIKGKISAALGIEAPMFAEPTISPQLADMLNEQMSTLYDSVAVSVEYTFTREEIDCWLVRSGEAVPPVFGGQGNEAPDTYAEAITAYADSPNYYVDDGTPYLVTYFNASAAVIDEVVQNYKIEAGQVLVSFDTSSLSGKTVTSATLRLFIPAVGVTTTYGTNQVNLYNHSFGTVGSGDWTGGTLISTTTFTDSDEGAYKEFTLATTDINTGGNTQFRLGNKVEIDGNYPTEPTSASHERQQVRFYYQVTGDYQIELVVEAIG